MRRIGCVLLLLPLVDCNDATIRQGVRAMLADRLVLQRLRAESGRWAEYADRQKRGAALKEFHAYAYQWY